MPTYEPTPGQLAADMAAILARFNVWVEQLRDWLAGTVTGGPNSDGRYPVTDVIGTTYLVQCPAKQAARVDEDVDGAAAHAAAADAARIAAVAAQVAAEAARALTLTYRADAIAARDLAQTYANTAGTHAANAATFDPSNFYTKAQADARFAPL